MITTIFDGGFEDPTFDSQAIFRGLMDATANPGTIVDLGTRVAAPKGLDTAAASVLLALADYDTPIFLDCGEAQNVSKWLAFHASAAVVEQPSNAAFAVLNAATKPVVWDELPVGNAQYPDRSATVLIEVDGLTGGEALSLQGPGIETTKVISPVGLPDGFLALRDQNHTLYPLGIDMILTCGSEILALPRTTKVEDV